MYQAAMTDADNKLHCALVQLPFTESVIFHSVSCLQAQSDIYRTTHQLGNAKLTIDDMKQVGFPREI